MLVVSDNWSLTPILINSYGHYRVSIYYHILAALKLIIIAPEETRAWCLISWCHGARTREAQYKGMGVNNF